MDATGALVIDGCTAVSEFVNDGPAAAEGPTSLDISAALDTGCAAEVEPVCRGTWR